MWSPSAREVEAERIDVDAPSPAARSSGPSTVEVPFGSQTLNHEKCAILPGLLRTATMRPLSACATASHFSVSPVAVDHGRGEAAPSGAPSSEDSQTSPLSM